MKIIEAKTRVINSEVVNPKNESIEDILDCRWSASFGLQKHPSEKSISYNVTFTLDIDFSDYFRYNFSVENLTFYELSSIKPDINVLLKRCRVNFLDSYNLMKLDLKNKDFNITVSEAFPLSDGEALGAISPLIEHGFSNLN